MWNNHLSRWLYFVLVISLLMLPMIEGKIFGGGFKRGPKRSGVFSRPSGYHQVNRYSSGISKPRSGSKLGNFAAGAAGAAVAYGLMRAISGSHRSRPHTYHDGKYGSGEVCVNNENLNGRVFGKFTCPLPGFPYEARACCGEYGRQYCCIPETHSR